MKYFMYRLLVIAAVIVAIWGCSSREDGGAVTGTRGLSTVELSKREWLRANDSFRLVTASAGAVSVSEYSFRGEEQSLVLRIDTDRGDLFYLELAVVPVRPGAVGAEATLMDAAGSLAWQYRFEVDEMNPETRWITEKTAEDSLTIGTFLESGQVIEDYTQNGEKLRLAYPVEWQDAILGESLQKLSPEVVSARTKIREEFAAFYDNENTLNNNVAGRLTTELIMSEQLAFWMTAEIRPVESDNVKRTLKELCHFARTCMVIKCANTPPSSVNYLCDICTVVAVFCGILQLVGVPLD